MIDFPIGELMDEAARLQWLERHLYPSGLCCPRCGSRNYRVFRPTQAFPGYRCQDCDGAFTMLTGTAFEKTRQKPSTLVLFLRGVAQGETTARLSRALSLSSKQALTLRHRLQDNVNETAPVTLMGGQHFEADEVYQNAGEKGDRHALPDDPPRRRANKQPGRGTFSTDRPAIFQVVSRDTGEVRLWVCETADKETCQAILGTLLPPGSILYSDELAGYHG